MSHPLSESQLRFWKGHLLQPDAPFYNMAWRFDLNFRVDPDVFRRAFFETVQNNDILRTVFREGAEAPRQVVLDTVEGLPEWKDASQAPDAAIALERELDAWVQVPFDLERETMRSQLVKLADDHWVWAVCQHHIVCDAQASVVLFEQVSQRYAGIEQNGVCITDRLPSFFESPPMRTTAGALAAKSAVCLPSPPYGSEPKRAGFSKRIPLEKAQELHDRLEHAVTQPEFRLFTPDLSKLAIYLTAYFGYLHRVTGDDQITIGLPSHNRLSGQDKRTLGLFAEVLPLNLELNADDTLSDIHAKVKTGLGGFLRQAKPGAVATMDTSGISAVCNYIQAEFGGFAGRPATVKWLHSGAHDVAHALRLHIMDFHGNGKPELFMDVHDEILDSVSATALQDHFLRVLETIVDAPQTLVSALDIAAEDYDRAIVFGPQMPANTPETVLDAFAAQVVKSPDSVALSCADDQMSFRQLDWRSDQIAAFLADLGVSPGHPIAINLPRSMDFVLVMLGVLKAGCSFVPIAANTPNARTEQIVEMSGAAAVFVPPNDNHSFVCPSLNIERANSDAPHSFEKPSGDDSAYVLFTSGSTGVPKGVEVNHNNLSRYIHWAAKTFSGERPSHYAFFSSVSFDLTLTSLFAPLVTGGSIRIYPERSDPDLAVLDVFAEDAVDLVKLTPSHLALACKQGRAVARIQTLILGGENLTSQLCRKAIQTLSPSLTLVNEYGPTEAVVGAMHHIYNPDTDTKASVQIGAPADGVSVSVRDNGMNLCPVGVAGEITIGGRLAEGYLDAPSETSTKFLNDPKAVQGIVYRTGDIGRINTDGSFDYLGRADQQVKIGGVRFEVAEFDRVLRHMPGVNAVHVSHGPATLAGQDKHCKSCGISNLVPGVAFPNNDICEICAEFDSYKDRAQAYFRDEPELRCKIVQSAQMSTGNYDAVMMLSGGKDSTYAAYRLAEYSPRVLAVTLDNGYISEQSKTNIQRVVGDLGWEHRYLRTDKMNQIFVDSLNTHSNVCQGCFKALYTLAFRTALAEGAPMVVTGLSRGQFFETRLTPDLFRNAAPTCSELDNMVTKARKAYHAEDDALSKLLETDDLKDGRFLDQIEVLDIYRYIDVPVAEIYEFLDKRTAWQRPSDTGRSTNCLINDAGIHFHKAREGYHNYALPYSWDVRLGHKTREQALDELNDDIDTQRVEEILDEIGFDTPVHRQRLSVYVAGRDIQEQDIWQTLKAHFPPGLLPDDVIVLEDMPLSPNGKVDQSRLPSGRRRHTQGLGFAAPATETEKKLASILSAILGTQQIGATDDFFDLGVDSLAAIEIAMKANEQGFALPATSLFEYRTLRVLAAHADSLLAVGRAESSDQTLLELDDDDLSSISEALG